MAELAVRVETDAHPWSEVTGETRMVFDTAVAGVKGDKLELTDIDGQPAIVGDEAVHIRVDDCGFGPIIDRPTRGIVSENQVEEPDVREAVERLLSGEQRKEIATFVGRRAVDALLKELNRVMVSNDAAPGLPERAKMVRENVELALAELGPEAAETLGKLFVGYGDERGEEALVGASIPY